MNLLGIDIGGTKTSVCVGDEHGQIRASRRMPTCTQDSLDIYFKNLASMCHGVLGEAGLTVPQIDAIGISAPGPMDVRRGVLIAPPNNPGWHDVPVVAIVRQEFNRPVHFNNDANACALAEYWFGNHGVPDLLYLTCSTGMGGGIIANGELVQGITDTGGEVGHQILDPNGPLCGCGMRGCFEAFVGGRNLADQLRERIRQEHIKTAILTKAGGQLENIDFKAFAAAARDGDPFAVAEWDRFMERMAQGIGNLIMILNPQVVALGTFAIYEGEFLLAPLREKLKKYTWKWPREACRIVPSALGTRIGDLSALAVARTGARSSGAQP